MTRFAISIIVVCTILILFLVYEKEKECNARGGVLIRGFCVKPMEH